MTPTPGQWADPPRLVLTWVPLPALDDALVIRTTADFDGRPADSIRILHACRTCGSDRHGKLQVVAAPGDGDLHVSLSRSGDLAIVAVTDAGPVGVDLETVDTAGSVSSGALTTWVRKESVVKATGHGLAIDPDSIDVGPPDAPPRLTRWPVAEPIDRPVWMFDVAGPPGRLAAATVLSVVRPRIVTTRAAPAG